MIEASKSKFANRLALAAALLCVMVLFARSAAFEFTNWDDDILIWQNAFVNPPTWAALQGSWSHPHQRMYIPATYDVWWLLAKVGRWVGGPHAQSGLPPWPYHAANVLVHAANAALVYGILRLIRFGPRAAAIGALVFAVHPLQVEPVCWATGMKDLLSSCLALFSIFAYLAASGRWRLGRATAGHMWYSAALLGLFTGTLAKPGIVGAPLIAVALDVAFVSGWSKSTLLRAIGLFGMAVPSAVWTRILQPPADVLGPSVSVLLRPRVACHALGFYLLKVLVPSRLCIDYGLRPLVVLAETRQYLLGLLVPASALVLLTVPKHRKILAIAGTVFVAGVFPVLGLVPFVFQAYSTVADRYAYLSMLGVGLVAAYAATLASKRIHQWALVTIISGLGFLAWKQVSVWHDSVTLMTQCVRVNPTNTAGHLNLGAAVYPVPAAFAGMKEHAAFATKLATLPSTKDVSQVAELSEALFWRALANRPESTTPLKNLILSYAARDRFTDAMRIAELTYRLGPIAGFNPENVIDLSHIGWLYMKVGNREMAYRCAFMAIHRDSGNRDARSLLAELDVATTQPATRPATQAVSTSATQSAEKPLP